MERIESLDDPRVAPYRDLKERELAARSGLFIVEGEHVVQRLLGSAYPVESVLLSERRAEDFGPQVREGIPVYVISDALMRQVLGFKFHSGVIATGRRKEAVGLDRILLPSPGRAKIVICPQIANTENLGSIIRIAAGFGADALLLGEYCCDPFYRQAIRVSMGTVFHLPIVQSKDLMADLRQLKERWGVQLVASVLAEDARPLKSFPKLQRFGLLLGNEAQGLDEGCLALADHRVTIPMKLGTDSLNVAVAAAVFLYQMGD